MATNPSKADRHRGSPKSRQTEAFKPRTERGTKRNSGAGQFIDQNGNPKPFEGGRREAPTAKEPPNHGSDQD